MLVRLHPANLVFLLVMVAAGIAACAGSGPASGPPNGALPALRSDQGSSPIKHVVIIIQENRSFDNFFATFPNANGAKAGLVITMPKSIAQACAADKQRVIAAPTSIPLTEVSIVGKGFPTIPPNGPPFGWNSDLPHTYPTGYLVDCNSSSGEPHASTPCQMNAFDVQHFGPNGEGGPTCTYLYQYVNPQDVAPYWDMAEQYVLADNTFQSQGSSSFTGHQDLIAGGTMIKNSPSESAIDNPTGFPWGCDSNSSAKVPFLTTSGQYVFNGPSPCYPVYGSAPYTTMRDLLDAKGVSWKFYANQVYPPGNRKAGGSGIWSAFDAIAAVRHGSEWGKKVVWPDTKIFNDINRGRLPAVSWITPNGANSDHPGEQCKCDKGPSWVASIVNAIGLSKYWKSSAIVVVWDDWGGYYDHVPPPFYDGQGGLGFRIPLLIVSPYVQPHVEHTQYETVSILRFVEDNWSLGTLGKLDERATSIGNAFDFTQAPRPFKKIPGKYSTWFFLHEKPSGIPPDTE
jgi:phospholipase C